SGTGHHWQAATSNDNNMTTGHNALRILILIEIGDAYSSPPPLQHGNTWQTNDIAISSIVSGGNHACGRATVGNGSDAAGRAGTFAPRASRRHGPRIRGRSRQCAGGAGW